VKERVDGGFVVVIIVVVRRWMDSVHQQQSKRLGEKELKIQMATNNEAIPVFAYSVQPRNIMEHAGY